MTRWFGLVGALVALSACSGGGNDSASSTSSPVAAASCAKTDRHGTYMESLKERPGGTCGAVQDQLVSLDTPDKGCTYTAQNWSDGDCRFDSSADCVLQVADAASYGGFRSVHASTVGYTTETQSGGGRIEGTVTITVNDSKYGCTSTYDLTAIRQ